MSLKELFRFSIELRSSILNKGCQTWHGGEINDARAIQHKAYFMALKPAYEALGNGNLHLARKELVELKNSVYESTEFLNETILDEFLLAIDEFLG